MSIASIPTLSRGTIVGLIVCTCLGLLWLRSHFRADRVQWFVGSEVFQFVSARGRFYVRHEVLGYSFPHWERLAERIRPQGTAGTNYRNVVTTLGREIDRNFAGFEYACGEDDRLQYWGYRMTYSDLPSLKNPFWSIQIPTWFVFALVAIPTIGLARGSVVRRRRWLAGHCVRCDYDLRASVDRCPECGAKIDSKFPQLTS